MHHRKPVLLAPSLFLLVAMFLSACQLRYSQAPLTTPTSLPTSLFVSPFPTSDNPMALVEELSTGTAMAEFATAMTAGTPAVSAATATPSEDVNATATEMLGGEAVASETPTLAVVTPSPTQPLPTVTTNRPASYTLQKGEFPYCIARRFNVDPAELLNLNGLTSGDIYYPNLTLKIPQSGNPFPGTRALRTHPDTYTVADASLTLYGVACVYGDVDPAAIAQANNLSLSTALTVGQKLSIP
ncbi:MAG: hypothetical protein Fur0043_22070 [Anaerolineales bacterium]